jgi:SulP family sulfate permease
MLHAMPNGAGTAHRYRPKLATALTEGYGADALRHDVMAGLTVAVLALPLSMAIAVASGVGPERGLWTAIVGGAVVSALGGSRFQIGGPAGAFILLVASTVGQFGLNGLILAVLLSGVFLTILGVLRLGSLIRRVPHAVTVGFTVGIAVIILGSQIRDLTGLQLAGPEPHALIPKLAAYAQAMPGANPAALALGAGVAVVILALRRWKPALPGMLIAVAAATVAAVVLNLPVETIGSRFGGLPSGLPFPALPRADLPLLLAVLPSAAAFTLLGGIESLLSATVADRMTGRVHRANMELVAQGLANVASALFGGIAVTGTIARTAANIRAGARSPIAGLVHCAALLAFMVFAAPVAAFIPLSALAGVLVVVAWNMAEKAEVARLLASPSTAVVLIVTFGVTLLSDLTLGIFAGCLAAALAHGLAVLRGRKAG